MKRYVRANFGKKGGQAVLAAFFILLIALSVGGALYIFYGDSLTDKENNQQTAVLSAQNANTTVFSIKDKKLKMSVGDRHKVKITTENDSAVDAIEWESSDSKVAHIDPDGNIVALKKGKVKITATAGYYSSGLEVTVKGSKGKTTRAFSTAYTANKKVVNKNKKDGSGRNLYYIDVNRLKNCVTVYTYDKKGKYTVPVRAMICSCGDGDKTPMGTFSVGVKNRWHPLYGNVYGQYTTAFNGEILFHSVPYEKMDKPGSVEVADYNGLGTSISMGCVRLAVADAKWIYDNCPDGTVVRVYEDEKDGPLGKPASMKINTGKSTGWDPTDDNKKNPYYKKTPNFDGVVNVSINLGEKFDPMTDVSARDTCGSLITDKVKVTGSVNTKKSGEYLLEYTVKDDMGRSKSLYRYVTVR
ncbi:MAG: L,D-transpeptidase family protein [Ruminococcus sp.]